jgi:hypothetical protein
MEINRLSRKGKKNQKQEANMPSMGKKMELFFLAGIFLFSFSRIAMAQHGHGSGHGGSSISTHGSGGGSHSMPMMNRPVQSVTVDGYKVSLDIMDMSMHASMQKMKENPAPGETDHAKSHAIMVMIQDTASKEIITDAKVSYRLISPSGAKETGNLDWSGDHYGRGFDAKEKESYQVELKIEGGGMEREAKLAYTI